MVQFLKTFGIGFLFLAVIFGGAFFMAHGNMHSGNCIAASTVGIDCPMQIGAVSYASMHLGFLKVFSLAVFGESITSEFLLALVFLFVAGLVYRTALLFNSCCFSLWRYRLLDFLSSQNQKFIHWLALQENSPGIRALA